MFTPRPYLAPRDTALRSAYVTELYRSVECNDKQAIAMSCYPSCGILMLHTSVLESWIDTHWSKSTSGGGKMQRHAYPMHVESSGYLHIKVLLSTTGSQGCSRLADSTPWVFYHFAHNLHLNSDW
jgi:hypothetical protein